MRPIIDGFLDGIKLAFGIFCALCVIGIFLSLFSC